MSDFLCPICQRPNDSSAQRCWYCQAPLSPAEKPIPGGTDWLDGFRAEAEKPAEPASETPAFEQPSSPEEEVPEWLVRIRQLEQAEREKLASTTENTTAAPEEDNAELPDWLREIKAGNSGKRPSPATPSEPSGEETPSSKSHQEPDSEVEEWLNHLAAWKPASIPEIDEQSNKQSDQSLWQQFQPLARPADESQAPEPIELLGNWQESEPQKQSDQESAIPVDNESSAKLSPVDAVISEQETSAPEPNQGEDLSEQNDNFTESIFTLNEPSNPQVNADFEEPSSPVNAEPENQAAFNEEPITGLPFLPDDLPDWLDSASLESPDKNQEDEVIDEPDSNDFLEGIEKASLPSWLQAIRPPSNDVFENSESAISRNTDEKGLLAGIEGTLQTVQPAESARKPVSYGSTIKVSERQIANANLFTRLTEEALEGKPASMPKAKSGRRRLLQLLLAAILIGTIILMGSSNNSFAIQPILFPPEVVAAYDAVNALPADQPVLLAADFEPAATGELRLSSRVLLEHLMRRNLNFATLAVNPVGDPIIINLLEETAQSIDGFDIENKLVSLGYLPGGSSGLQLLRDQPRIALPNSYDVQAAWNTLYLTNVQSLDDFSAVIVISDKPESARAWVEQVQPGLTDTPLIFVISAQAAPLLQPFFKSGQISGFLPGLSGSNLYQKMLYDSSATAGYFSAYQICLILIALMILLGGLVNLVRPASKSDKKDGSS